MKKTLLTLVSVGLALTAAAQPRLSEDNIDEVLRAMTLQEKASLLVGGARAAIVNGVTSGVAAEVPGAAGNTRPVERLGIPATSWPTAPPASVSSRRVRDPTRPFIAPDSRWARSSRVPGTPPWWKR